jgi:hypothetical protein
LHIQARSNPGYYVKSVAGIDLDQYLLQHRIENCPEDIDLIVALKFIKNSVNGEKISDIISQKVIGS